MIESLLQQQITASTLAAIWQRVGPAPTLQVLENAAQAAYDPAQAASLGLKPFLDTHGVALNVSLSSGLTASAFRDPGGNVIIGYQGTTTAAQQQLDVGLLSGTDPSKLQGFSDALRFASEVRRAAADEGIDRTRVFVAGHSLGGTLASYVASQTGLGGASFAGSGVPGYQATATPAANFISFVEKGDPFANYATDAGEKNSAVVGTAHMDHYGTVVSLGSTADAVELGRFASQIAGYSIGAALSGGTSLGTGQMAAFEQQFYGLMGEHHGLNTYEADAASAIIPATAYGLQNTSMIRFMASMASDAKALLADIPRIFAASGPTAALDRFAGDFPDLARQVTSVMHAPTFRAAIGEIASVEPALYGAITSPQGLTAIVNALGHHSVGLMPLHTAT